MKKYPFLKLVLILYGFLFISWNHPGHHAINRMDQITTDTSVCDKMFDGKYIENSQITLLNLGGSLSESKNNGGNKRSRP